MKQKDGTPQIIIGIILVIIQLMCIISNAKVGIFPNLRFDSLGLFFGDLAYLLGYLFVGILGIAFIIIGERIHNEYKSARSHKIQNAYFSQSEEAQSTPSESNTPSPISAPTPKIPLEQDPLWAFDEVAPLIRRYLSTSLAIIAFIVIAIAMNYQDVTRNEMERTNPSLIYFIFLTLFGLYFAVIHYGKRKLSEKPQAAYPVLLSLAVFVALHEGSVFSNSYFDQGQYIVYSYMDTLSVLNVIWSAIPFMLLFVNQPGFIEMIWRACKFIKRQVLSIGRLIRKISWKAVIIAAIAVIACQSIYLIGQSNSRQSDNTSQSPQVSSTFPTSPPASTSPTNPTAPPLIQYDRPKNGYIIEHPAGDMVAPLTVKTSGTNDYYIALKHISTSSQNMSFYVRGGSTVDLDVPLGEYDIYYASGSAWYGKDDLFGPTGSYHKCEDTFAFTLSGDTYDGWTLTLYPVANGNLDTEEINIDEFPK